MSTAQSAFRHLEPSLRRQRWMTQASDRRTAAPTQSIPTLSTVGTSASLEANAGEYLDQETELAYNGFRCYSPELGRYLEADPIGITGGINLYAYVLNRPIALADSTGLQFKPTFAEQLSLELSGAIPALGGLGIGGGFDFSLAVCCDEDGKLQAERVFSADGGVSVGALVRASGAWSENPALFSLREEGFRACCTPTFGFHFPVFSGNLGPITATAGRGTGVLPQVDVGIGAAVGIGAIFNLFNITVPLDRIGPLGDCGKRCE